MKHVIEITAILCITLLEAIALFVGVNGTIFSLSIAGIAGIGGHVIGKARSK